MNRRSVDTSLQVLTEQENFWRAKTQQDVRELLKYSLFLGFFAFSGYLFSYTIRGKVWNVWPFIHTTLDVGSGIVFAALQWILFATFPVLASLLMEMITSRAQERVDFYDALDLITYSLTPLVLSTLFIGVPYVDRILTTMGFATWIFLLYYGFRYSFAFTIARSISMTLIVFALFAMIRELFVFAIGY
jgi:hypothetical protein